MATPQPTHIYKINCKNTEIKDCYIGFSKGMKMTRILHKNNTNNENLRCYNYPVYKFIREHGGFYNWSITILETVYTNDKKVIMSKKKEWYDKEHSTLNSQKPNSGTKKEWYDNNKDYFVMWRNDHPNYYRKKLI